MKKSGILMGVIVVSFILAAIPYIGCSREAETDVVAPTGGTTAADAYTMTVCDGNQVTVLSPQFTRYTQSTHGEYDQVLQLGEVQYMMAKFDSVGYTLDLPNSFIMAGSGISPDSTDTIAVRIVNVILRYRPDSTSSFVWIGYVSSLDHANLPKFITTSLWSFVPPVIDPDSYEEAYAGQDEHGRPYSVWVKDYQSPFDPKDADGSMSTFGWKRWAGCMITNLLTTCATAAGACALSGPGWLGCTGTGCAAGALGSAVYCTFSQWFGG